MLYEKVSEQLEGKRLIRTFRNIKTGNETKLGLIHEDKDVGRWWAFEDLYKMPIMRVSMAQNITNLYGIGLTLKDIIAWCTEEKKLLKSNDPEKYEKLYALILEKERLATFTSDPIKQQLALCTVYVVADDERIDYFDEAAAQKKLEFWKGLPGLVSFFLTWQTNRIGLYMKTLNKISQTVLAVDRLQKQKGQ